MKKTVACIITEYRENSHADVIVGKILEGYDQQGGKGPALRVASMFTDQVPENDMSRALARKHGVHLASDIEEAITLGQGRIAVDGVLLIGEHGTYLRNVKGQHLYPRPRFMEDTLAVFDKYGTVRPVFNDKHLAYNWHNAIWMYEQARSRMIPFMAGSSLPLTYRRPRLQIRRGTPLKSALAVGYGGFESYGFHALETLQCMVERRATLVQGVQRVVFHDAARFWDVVDESPELQLLLQAAIDVAPHREGDVREITRGRSDVGLYEIEYRDGFRGWVAMLNGYMSEFAFACLPRGSSRPLATWFYLYNAKPYPHFAYLVRAIEQMILTGHPSYPVERTLLTTGILDAVMTSRFFGGRAVDTPYLADVHYTPVDYPFAPDPDLGVVLPGVQ